MCFLQILDPSISLAKVNTIISWLKEKKIPNTTAPLFCTLSKSLQMTYREIKSHLPNDSVHLEINRTSATLS